MIVLGVDPGTLVTGYGVIEAQNNAVRVLSFGAIKNNAETPMPERLNLIYDRLTEVIRNYHPDELAIETAFYGKNAQSALKLGHARGVAMLSAVREHLAAYEYSPREVKKALVGTGKASKGQVQFMVTSLLQIKEPPKYYDITDALAVAICHVQRRITKQQSNYKSWKAFIADHPEKVTRSFLHTRDAK